MRVFISWSKPRSQAVAAVLRMWLPEVIQSIEPWMSSEDIGKGLRWSNEIADNLDQTRQGLICVTADNIAEPWLNFEAGALAKSLDEVRVTPVLFDVEWTDVRGPLAQFQHVNICDRADVARLIGGFNDRNDSPLDPTRLERAFDRAWPDLERSLATVREQHVSASPPQPRRTHEDLLVEVLDRVRGIERSLRTDSTPDENTPHRFLSRGEMGARGLLTLSSGDAVRHDAFGIGTVVSAAGEGDALEATIQFGGDVGTKRLLLKYAPLRRVPNDAITREPLTADDE